MKIKHIFTSVIVATALGLGITSCDYLDIVPVEQPSLDNAMDSYDKARGYLLSTYAGVSNPYGNADWSNVGTASYLQPLPGNIRVDLTLTTDEWILNNYQFDAYTQARNANRNDLSSSVHVDENKSYYFHLSNVILFQQKLQEIGIPRGIVEPEEATEWLAEAKFLSAYYHFMLLRRYGPIAIIDKRVSMDATPNSFPGRMHYDYCVNWICQRLDEAAEVLPATRIGSENGRATSVICKALKARVLLYAASPLFNGQFPFKDWTNKIETPGYGTELVSQTYDREKWVRAKDAAEEALKVALNEGGRSLYEGNTANETDKMISLLSVPVDFDNDAEKKEFIRRLLVMRNVMCTKESQGNYEYIWSVPNNNQATNYRTRMPRQIIAPNSQLTTGYKNGYYNAGTFISFTNLFMTSNGLQPANDPDFASQAEWYTSAGYEDAGERKLSHIIKLFKNREPRFYAWMAFDGGEYGTLLYNNTRPVYIDMLSYAGTATGFNPTAPREHCPTGIGVQKWIDPKANVTTAGKENFFYTPRPLIRLAELYLTLAECHAELGNTKDALDNINVIRRRAGVTELTEAMVNTSKKSLVDWARDERSVELFDELHRYFDVRRWCKGEECFGKGKRLGFNAEKAGISFKEYNIPTEPEGVEMFKWDDRMYLYPISKSDLYSNPNCVQSPGY